MAINPRWGAIVAFYAAMHLVERLAAVDDLHHSGHVGPGSRHTYLSGHPRHRAVLREYMLLHRASMVARYEPVRRFQAHFPAVRRILIDGCLTNIERYVAGVLSPTATS